MKRLNSEYITPMIMAETAWLHGRGAARDKAPRIVPPSFRKDKREAYWLGGYDGADLRSLYPSEWYI